MALTNISYEEALDEVHTRFILNLPPSELQSSDRIFFQLEQAWWYYDDFLCDNNKELPRFKSVKPFARKMFEISPLLSGRAAEFDKMWQYFGNYKRKISTYGCALLNKDMDQVVLCQTFGGRKAWCFPMGKINQGESGLDAAARETYEETGFDITKFGSLREKDKISYDEEGKLRTLYIFVGTPESFSFEPVARKEISDVQFFPLHGPEITNLKTFAVNPFVGMLKKWVKSKKVGGHSSRASSRSKSRGKNRSRSNSETLVREGDNVTASGLASPGDKNGWSEEDMFRVNEDLIGKKVEYSGNPHEFSTNSIDPHRFRVVGGSFLNSGLVDIAPPPESSKLQPLFRKSDDENDDDNGLTPFFVDGKSPFDGIILNKTSSSIGDKKREEDKKTLLALLRVNKAEVPPEYNQSSHQDSEFVFMTDAEVTTRSQEEKGLVEVNSTNQSITKASDLTFSQKWLQSLERPRPSKRFGEFKFDVDKIMDAAFSKRKGTITMC